MDWDEVCSGPLHQLGPGHYKLGDPPIYLYGRVVEDTKGLVEGLRWLEEAMEAEQRFFGDQLKMFALDLEWKPVFKKGEKSQAALLQVGWG